MRLSVVAILFLPLIALADSLPSTESTTIPNSEQRLITAFEEAEKSGLLEAQAATSVPIAMPSTAHPTPAPKPKISTSEMLENLAKEVDTLRAKNEVMRYTALSTQKPRASKHTGAKLYYSYQEGDVYELRAGIDRVTDVALQPGEELTTLPVSGDTIRWKIGIIQSGKGPDKQTHIIVKPLDTGIETNLLITTNKRVYHMRAVSGDWYMPAIAWHYPDEEDAALAAAMLKSEEEEVVGIPPEDLRFDYDIDGDEYPWKPLRVFDDGQKTYLQMPKSLRVNEAPALFIIEDGEPMLVNYRVKGDYYIVDRLFEEAQLRVGINKKVIIRDSTRRRSIFERIFE